MENLWENVQFARAGVGRIRVRIAAETVCDLRAGQPGRERPLNSAGNNLARGRRGRSRPGCCTCAAIVGRQTTPPVLMTGSATNERQLLIASELRIIGRSRR